MSCIYFFKIFKAINPTSPTVNPVLLTKPTLPKLNQSIPTSVHGSNRQSFLKPGVNSNIDEYDKATIALYNLSDHAQLEHEEKMLVVQNEGSSMQTLDACDQTKPEELHSIERNIENEIEQICGYRVKPHIRHTFIFRQSRLERWPRPDPNQKKDPNVSFTQTRAAQHHIIQ